MDNTNFWFSSGAGGGPVPPVPVPGTANSLRFSGAENLERTFATNGSATRTVSFWMKKDVNAATLTHLF